MGRATVVVSLIALVVNCGFLSDAFSCKDEEEKLNAADVAYERVWDARIKGEATASQLQDALHERSRALHKYNKCKGHYRRD